MSSNSLNESRKSPFHLESEWRSNCLRTTLPKMPWMSCNTTCLFNLKGKDLQMCRSRICCKFLTACFSHGFKKKSSDMDKNNISSRNLSEQPQYNHFQSYINGSWFLFVQPYIYIYIYWLYYIESVFQSSYKKKKKNNTEIIQQPI